MKFLLFLLLLNSLLFSQKVEFEVLGSGGPEIDGRASTSYILWIDDKARLIVDMGSGSMLGFEKSHARLEDVEAVVLTHLHIDHCVDLPSYVKAGYFSQREAHLDIIAPSGNDYFPGTDEYLENLFGKKGAYRYMSDVLSRWSDSFRIVPIEIKDKETREYKDFTLTFERVYHGIVPALAVAILVDGKKIIISGDTNNKDKNLEKLAKNADLFIAHHAIPEHTNKFAKTLHMTPSIIAQVAQSAKVKKVILTHRMNRTLNKEKKSLKIIQEIYTGEVIFAEDKMKLKL